MTQLLSRAGGVSLRNTLPKTRFLGGDDISVVSCCGDVNVSGSLTASDALLVLKAAVGSDVCPLLPCICDTNGNGTITASDALAVLRRAVGQDNALACHCS